MTVIVHFLRNCVIITGFHLDESVPKDGLDAERIASCETQTIQIVRNLNVFYQFRRNCYTTSVSLSCSKVSQGIFAILAILEPRLAASFMKESKPVFF